MFKEKRKEAEKQVLSRQVAWSAHSQINNGTAQALGSPIIEHYETTLTYCWMESTLRKLGKF
jgi:hypothetical protein